MIKKTLVFILIFISSILFAAFFGIVHDEITYSISPEYYTAFKFDQFGIFQLTENDRLGAALVGVFATWWVGIPFGVIFGFIYLIKRIENFKTHLMKMYLTSSIITLTSGFLGLAYAFVFIEKDDFWSKMYIPEIVVDKQLFLAVGLMHTFSYLGGIIALIVGIIYFIRIKKQPI